MRLQETGAEVELLGLEPGTLLGRVGVPTSGLSAEPNALPVSSVF